MPQRESDSSRKCHHYSDTLLGERNDVRIFDEDGSHRTPAELCLLAAREVAMLPDDEG
jgi:hypothetical protein